MLRPIHFEIQADEPVRAVQFYMAIFGWDIKKWEGQLDYWLVTTGDEGPGINGAIMKRRVAVGGDAIIGYVVTVDVPAIDDYIARVTQNGGMVAMDKIRLPGVGWHAYCRDTEGNIFGMLEPEMPGMEIPA